MVKASLDYATDSTIYVADGSTTMRKSSNGGDTFSNIGVPAAVTALVVVDKDTYFTGATAKVYKSGRWKAATGLDGDVKSIALSPGYATDSTVLVGNDDGDIFISSDDGAKFTRIGIDDEMGDMATVTVLPDKGFVQNTTIYAGSSINTSGVKRATSTARSETTAAFKALDDDGDSLVVNGLVAGTDGTLYAASGAADMGIRRSLDPLTAISAPGATPVTAPTFESMLGGSTAAKGMLPAGAILQNLAVISGSNVLYAVAKGQADQPFGEVAKYAYGYGDRLITIADILIVKAEQTSPERGLVLTTDTYVTLKWAEFTGAKTYQVQVNTSSDFGSSTAFSAASVIVSDTKREAKVGLSSSPGFGVTALKGGTKYYWRVRSLTPQMSPWSDALDFHGSQ